MKSFAEVHEIVKGKEWLPSTNFEVVFDLVSDIFASSFDFDGQTITIGFTQSTDDSLFEGPKHKDVNQIEVILYDLGGNPYSQLELTGTKLKGFRVSMDANIVGATFVYATYSFQNSRILGKP
jgi:hypothetical protein